MPAEKYDQGKHSPLIPALDAGWEKRQLKNSDGKLLWHVSTNHGRRYIAVGTLEEVWAIWADPDCNAPDGEDDDDSPIEIAVEIEPVLYLPQSVRGYYQ